jgi:cytochrome b561
LVYCKLASRFSCKKPTPLERKVIVQDTTTRSSLTAKQALNPAARSDQSAGRYDFAARCFHWLTASLVLAAFISSIGGPEAHVFAAGSKGALTLHESLGFAVLLTTLLRLAHRPWATTPAPACTPNWMHQSARITHVLLYFLLVIVPVSAILGSWIDGHSLTFYLVGGVASPWATSQALGGTILSLHKWAGDAVMWLAGVHAAAALFHHFILRDTVLRSMIGSS